jgi:hypothetical protein
MKKLIKTIEVFVLLGSVVACHLSADPIQDINQSMSGAAPSARASAMQNFVLSLGTAKGEGYMLQAVPVLTSSLSDSDVVVRQNAAVGLLMVATVTAPMNKARPPNSPDPLASPSTQQALLKATSDSDEVVRLTALKTYSAAYKLTPDVEDKIIAEFNAPESKANDPGDKVAMIECLLLSGSPSTKAQNFLSNLIDDPKYGVHVAERMGADNCPLSSDALGKLAAKIGQDKNPVHRAAFARAIGAYGKQAQQYTPQLQAALASETDEVTKQNLQRAIAKTQ